MGRKRQEAIFREEVDLKYQVYNGLFLGLPFPEARRAGILLPVFAGMISEALAAGTAPAEIVRSFFADREPVDDEEDQTAILFRFIQLVERQIVLFDALEDAAFPRIHDIEGMGTLNEILHRLDAAGKRSDLGNVVDRFHVRIVLTAHPTQFYPADVLAIIPELSEALQSNDLSHSHELLLQLGKTRFRNRRKPSPRDEARSLVWYLENVFYQAMPQIHGRVVGAVRTDIRTAARTAPTTELGFWPGGDRDGNPFVDADTTRQVSAMLRRSVLRLYIADVEQIAKRLTFDGAAERINAIDARLRVTLAAVDGGAGAAGAGAGAPSGAYAGAGAGRGDDGDAGRGNRATQEPYTTADQLVDDLLSLIEYLETDHDGLFTAHVEMLLWRVVVFGLHFATLDVRQDSRMYARAAGRIRDGAATATAQRAPTGHAAPAAHGTYASPRASEPSADAMFDEFVNALEADEVPSREAALGALADDPVLSDTVESLTVVREIQAAVGPRGVHRAIISNTRSAANVLQVMYLARVAGFPGGNVNLDVVPLFETVDDLTAAPEIMRRLYTTPVYRNHLAQRNDTQQIMLGFSDGTKDGGYITANWLIYRAREELTAVAATYGVRVVFFEGRGGPPARGGGKTHQFYRSMSPQSDREQIHLTIQGQTISSNYGTVDAARYNLEQLVTAALENILFRDTDTGPDTAQRELLESISSTSLERYHTLKNRADFLPYLETVTPLTFYGAANNASRPTSRGGGGSLRLEDLRAIPFVGAWSQMKQNVPGYFGFGTALRELIDAGHGGELRQLYRDELFFRTLVENSMQSLQKVNFDVTRHLDGDAQFGDLWRELRDEAERTVTALLDVSGTTTLLENDPVTARSIGLREAIVRPVLVIQQHALTQLRRDDLDGSAREAYRGLVVKSMAAIINAGRNSV